MKDVKLQSGGIDGLYTMIKDYLENPESNVPKRIRRRKLCGILRQLGFKL